MPDFPENNLLPTGEGYLTLPAEFDDGRCFEPFIPKVSVSPTQAGSETQAVIAGALD